MNHASARLPGPSPPPACRTRPLRTEGCGQPALDVRAYWTAADATSLLQACGAPGRQAYVDLQLLDLLYPAASGAMLLVVTALLLRRYGGRGWLLLVPAVVMVVGDYA